MISFMNVNHSYTSYRLPFTIAITGHLLLIVLLFFSFPQARVHWRDVRQTKKKPVNATVIDPKLLEQQVAAIHAEEQKKQQAQRKHLAAIEQQTLRATRKRHQEEQRLRAIKKARQRLKQQQLAEQRAAKQKALAAKKQLQAKQQALEDQRLAQQLAQERKRLSTQQKSLQTAQTQGQIDRYRAQILQVIENNWHPPQQNAKLSCVMIAHIAPGGVVTSVDIARSSHDAALDRSAQAAIYKSSPLPVPKDPMLFDAFRHLRIKMSPQDVKQ